MGSFLTSLADAAGTITHIRPLLRKERQSPLKVPLRIRLGMWRRGFLSESYVIYGLDRNDPADYLSDYAKFVRARRIDGASGRVLRHKLAFHQVLGAFAGFVPPTFAIIDRGRMIPVTYPGRPSCGPDLSALVRQQGRVVLKPMHGAGGKGIYIVEDRDGQFRVNREQASADALRELVRSFHDYAVVAFIQQHERLAEIFPDAVNTIRIQTMWDDGPFIAIAAQRIGSSRSYPVDNWSKGGLSALVDIESGRMGRAAAYPANGKLEWHDAHPDTGRQIAGVAIPHWRHIKDTVLEICRAVPYLKYVGWDIVVTDDGFRVLEGNNEPDVNLLQVHQPLLKDTRVRAFYRRYGVIRP